MPTVRSQTDKALLYSGANVENNFNSELDKKEHFADKNHQNESNS